MVFTTNAVGILMELSIHTPIYFRFPGLII